MRHARAVLASLLILAPAAGRAEGAQEVEDAPRHASIELQLGASFAQNETFTGGGRFDVRGPALGAAFGWRLRPWLGVDVGPAYEKITYEDAWWRNEFEELSVATHLRVRAPLRAVELAAYVGPSVHVGRWSYEDRSPYPYPLAARDSGRNVGYGVQAGVALGFLVPPNVFVGTDLRRTLVESYSKSSSVGAGSGYWARYHRVRAAVTLTWLR